MTPDPLTELIRAPIFHTPADPFRAADALVAHEDGGLLIRGGRIVASGAYADVRGIDPGARTLDYRGGCLLPGFIDTHIHFPQLRIIGGLGRTLLDWLAQVALPEEARMADVAHATRIARRFVGALAAHGTTTALVFGAHFSAATAALFEAAAATGLRVVSGLVLSDRELRPELHQAPEAAYQQCGELIDRFHRRGRLLYAVTPRFALSTSEAMLDVCQTLLREHDGLRLQTHVNENPGEIAACRAAFPWSRDYVDIYDRFALTGRHSVFAHDVHPTAGELERLAATRTSVAHCPCSNAALGSGIFPLRRHLDARVHCSLGTDVGGGIGFGMIKEALQAYLMQRVAPDGVSLDPAHLLYLSTAAGAIALGLQDETGDLQAGKSADFVYLRAPEHSPLAAVLERAGTTDEVLAAIFTLADADCVHEVRIGGAVVHRLDEPAADAGGMMR